MGALAGLAVISAVRAEEDTTAKIRKACKANDKTWWVESTGACIPKNPCVNDPQGKYQRYCSRLFRDTQTAGKDDEFLVDLYAQVRGLDCHYVSMVEKGWSEYFSNQDYSVCAGGTDVMVFEFDDVYESFEGDTRYIPYAICNILRATYDREKHLCFMSGSTDIEAGVLNEENCNKVKQMSDKHAMGLVVKWMLEPEKGCYINY